MESILVREFTAPSLQYSSNPSIQYSNTPAKLCNLLKLYRHVLLHFSNGVAPVTCRPTVYNLGAAAFVNAARFVNVAADDEYGLDFVHPGAHRGAAHVLAAGIAIDFRVMRRWMRNQNQSRQRFHFVVAL